MTAETINAWFTPFHYFVYLGTLLIAMVVYYQWKWYKVCKNNSQVLVIHADGSTHFELCPKKGSSVELKYPKEDTVRLWPIGKVSFIDKPYPGVDFLPQWLQKTIKFTIVDEDDWEPLINRDPEKRPIGSPALLGNLMHEKVSATVLTVNREMMDSLSGLVNRMGKVLSAQVFYIGIGIVIAVLVLIAYQALPVLGEMGQLTADMAAIKQSLGIQ